MDDDRFRRGDPEMDLLIDIFLRGIAVVATVGIAAVGMKAVREAEREDPAAFWAKNRAAKVVATDEEQEYSSD